MKQINIKEEKMKQSIRVLMLVMALSVILLSACGGTASTPSPAAAKVEAAEVAFTGVIESMNGTQWVVNGQTVTVDPAVVQNGPFKVGDTVKVEAKVAADGSVTVTRVETPGAPDNSNSANSNDANSNDANSNSANSNDANSNDGNSNDGNSNGGLVLDNNGSEAYGPVDAITTDTVTIGGQVFKIANGAEIKSQIQAGNFVKVHFILNADGTMSITQIETWDPSLVGTNDNSNSNLNNNTNDDHGNSNSNTNDDHGNSNSGGDSNSNGNDDHGGNDNGNP
jgi:hypothetical protein